MPLFIAFLALLLTILLSYLILSREEKEKSDFLHVMVHKFRSPISIIKWYIELLSDESAGVLNEKQKEYLAEIYKASKKLNENIDSLLILLQLQYNQLPIKRGVVDIKKLLENVISKLQFKIERHKLHLQESYPKDKEIATQTDSKLLSIVFQNILENAIKYTPENGNIDVSVNTSNKKIFIEIKDNGYGIPKEEKSRMLSSSVSSRDARFSLHLVKQLLGKLGGKVSFKSRENKGTTFHVLLPLAS